VQRFSEVSVEDGGDGSGGSAAWTLETKQVVDGASRIEAVLCGGKAQQQDRGECDDCRGRSGAQKVWSAAARGWDPGWDHDTAVR